MWNLSLIIRKKLVMIILKARSKAINFHFIAFILSYEWLSYEWHDYPHNYKSYFRTQ